MSWDKPRVAPCPPNSFMSPHTSPPTECHRAALLWFEAEYEQWRLAGAELAHAELHLWMKILGGADAQASRPLGAEILKLRHAGRAALHAVLAVLRQRP